MASYSSLRKAGVACRTSMGSRPARRSSGVGLRSFMPGYSKRPPAPLSSSGFVPRDDQEALLENVLERRHYVGVELRAGVAGYLFHGRVGGHGLAVGPVVRQGVERVRHGQDARLERDVLARQPVRIALTVPPFVVRERYLLG